MEKKTKGNFWTSAEGAYKEKRGTKRGRRFWGKLRRKHCASEIKKKRNEEGDGGR